LFEIHSGSTSKPQFAIQTFDWVLIRCLVGWRNFPHRIETSFADGGFLNYRILGHPYPLLGRRRRGGNLPDLFKLARNRGDF
jgi:hypothetical protein